MASQTEALIGDTRSVESKALSDKYNAKSEKAVWITIALVIASVALMILADHVIGYAAFDYTTAYMLYDASELTSTLAVISGIYAICFSRKGDKQADREYFKNATDTFSQSIGKDPGNETLQV